MRLARTRSDVLVHHVDLAHAARCGARRRPAGAAPRAARGRGHVAHDEIADARGLVARGQADRADAR